MQWMSTLRTQFQAHDLKDNGLSYDKVTRENDTKGNELNIKLICSFNEERKKKEMKGEREKSTWYTCLLFNSIVR